MNQISLAYLTVFGLSPPDHVTFAAKAGYEAVGLRSVSYTHLTLPTKA